MSATDAGTTEPSCEICLYEREDCGCDGEYEWCPRCGGSGEVVPFHCCACGGGEYDCICCPHCGSQNIGKCPCPATVHLHDGGTLTLPGSQED